MHAVSDPSPVEWARRQEKLDRLERWERRMAQQHADNSTAVRFHLLGCAVNIFFLVIPMVLQHWAWCQFYGIGLGSMWVQVSLTHMTVDISCKKNFIEDVICKLAQKISGKKMKLAAAYQLFCQPYFSPGACEAATAMYWNSYAVLFANFVACILQVLAGLFLWYYWNYSHLGRIKHWAVTFMFSSLVIATGGLTIWTMMCPQLSELPKSWSNSMSGLSGTHLFQVKATSTFCQYGIAWFVDVLGILLSLVSIGTFSFLVNSHEDEAAADLLEQISHDRARDQAAASVSTMGLQFYNPQPVVPVGTGSW